MHAYLPSVVTLLISGLLFILNTIVCGGIITVGSLFRVLFRWQAAQAINAKAMHAMYRLWAFNNRWIMNTFNAIEWKIEGIDNLSQKKWYLMIANHQSWLDILVLTQLALFRIPAPKFFLKEELRWIPVVGSGAWALDMPFMKRYSRKFLEKHPHLKGKDIETTKRSCEKFKKSPTTIINFVEGTRITAEKQKNSPFTYLLSPKAGGIAFTLAALDDEFDAILNVTLIYPDNKNVFWEMLNGKLKKVIVDIEIIPMSEVQSGDYFNDPVYREHFQTWLNTQWQAKDKLIANKLAEHDAESAKTVDIDTIKHC